MTTGLPASIDAVQALLAGQNYICGRPLATVAFLALKLGRPLFLEGEAGVGKTEIAKAIANGLGRRLIRLQCYEGLDAASAVCDWNFAAQMIAIRTAEATGQTDRARLRDELFTEDYLIERPLLAAMRPDPAGAPVLLIDELDRTDEPFEAFLLEALSDFQVTIPELGTIRAPEPPIVILTSNRTPVGMLHPWFPRREGKEIAQHPVAAEGAGAQPALGLDDHHQIGGIGSIVLPPDGALQRLGLQKLGHARQVAEDDVIHQPNLRTSWLTVARKS